MKNSGQTSSRRDALQQMLALTMGASLVGLSSCKDNSKASSQSIVVTADEKKIIPCKPLNIPPPEGSLEAPGGLNMRIRVRSTQTSNQFACAEVLVMPKQMGPAPHYHKELDEVMFVQKGVASVMVGDEIHEVKAGGWHIRPRNILHTFWNGQNEQLVFFDMFFNQNFEDFLEELFQKIIPEMMKKNTASSDPEFMKRTELLYARFGIVVFPEQRQPIIDKYGLKG
jgi:mannose-6-phosphate isomerase-like protein (cupin superfamily)